MSTNSADEVMDLVHRVMHRFRALQYQGLRDRPEAVTHLESKVLGFFSHHPGATLSALAEHSGRDKAQLARLVKRLLEIGLLEHAEAGGDRRSQPLKLSDAGAAVQRELQQQHRRLAQAAVHGLSAAERSELLRLLRHVDTQLDAED
ncbi:MarR family transcriptional regulator [Aquincola sp. S2]|uniref:MarR family transcriptional regulator n=1 Tax=Pseudaquabacterium terrae TaxID=2732868 RepID=A0ABX2ESD2_9BURK|nr:MarR family transcriptional regulator [Aquabacterium terrae]NRF71541.1 MarR family transcriptional regulator [Aquabacterium terrae]